MEKERPSHKQTSDETNLFCVILADPVNSFMEALARGALKKPSPVNYLIPLMPNLKKVWKIISSKKKNQKTLKQKRKKQKCWSKSKRFLEKPCSIYSSITIIQFLKLTFCSRFYISFYCICLLFFVTLALLELSNEGQIYCN